jgi:hypothetical protein
MVFLIFLVVILLLFGDLFLFLLLEIKDILVLRGILVAIFAILFPFVFVRAIFSY